MPSVRALLRISGLLILGSLSVFATVVATVVATVAATVVAQAAEPPQAAAPASIHRTISLDDRNVDVPMDSADNPLVLMQTSAGNIVLELFAQEAPQTVASFIDLASGNKPFIDPETREQTQRPFFDGLVFHRVVAGFMIEGGSVTGTGDGNPGFRLNDEISASSLGLDKMLVVDANGVPNAVLGIRNQQDFQQLVLAPLYKSMGIQNQQQLETRFTEVDQRLRGMTVMNLYELRGFHYRNELQSHAPVRGVIAMASNGPDRNDSRFFINLVDTPWLTGKHTVFGKVRLGMEVVDAIGKVPVDGDSHPLQPVTLMNVHPL